MESRSLTILFADIQGYTARTSRQTREEHSRFVTDVRHFIEDHAIEKGGILVKTMGDGFLLTFGSPTDAIICGQDIQSGINQKNQAIPDSSNIIRFRIGISTGEVNIDDNGDVFGDAVNIAARIESFAEPNGVYISEATYLSMNKSEISALDLGPQQFKNVMQEVRVYKVVQNLDQAARKIKKRSKKTIPRRVLKRLAIIIGILLFLSLIGIKNRLRKASRLLDNADYMKAAIVAENILKNRPLNKEARRIAIAAYIGMGSGEKVKEHFRKALLSDPEDMSIFLFTADRLSESGKHHLASNMLQEYIKKENNPEKKKKALLHLRKIDMQMLE